MISYAFLGPGSELTDLDREDLQSLLILLNKESRTVSVDDIRRVSKHAHVLVARDSTSGRIVGMATLVAAETLRKKIGHIEEVAVNPNYRGKGIGHSLVEQLITRAKELRLAQIELTSNPSRVEANKLYQNFGFTKRDTNVYRLIVS